MKIKYFRIIINLFLIANLIFINNIRNNKEIKIFDSENRLFDIQKYIDYVFNDILIDNDKIFYPNNNPKISIIISVYNGQAYLKKALLSIQNQDFKDIEIIMVDDFSLDDSVKLIKELMIKEPRIKLFKNNKNKGALFTKLKGIFLSKGKYILLLDEDDMYIQRDAFSTLFKISERYNLDLLNFRKIMSNPKLKDIEYERNKVESKLIFQPELSEMMFKHTLNGEIEQIGGTMHNYFIKRNIFIKIIKQIDKKYLNEKMNCHDDYMMFFLLTRNANKMKKIDRIFYLVLSGWNMTSKSVRFRIINKNKNKKYLRCNSLLNFIEFILYKTKNTIYDKKIAFFSYNKWLLNECKNYSKTREKALNISKQYLKNKYIQDKDKKKIIYFIKHFQGYQ